MSEFRLGQGIQASEERRRLLARKVEIADERQAAAWEVAIKAEREAESRRLQAQALAYIYAERDVPDYIEVDHGKLTAKLSRIPTLTEVPYPVMMEPHLVVEFYSR